MKTVKWIRAVFFFWKAVFPPRYGSAGRFIVWCRFKIIAGKFLFEHRLPYASRSDKSNHRLAGGHVSNESRIRRERFCVFHLFFLFFQSGSIGIFFFFQKKIYYCNCLVRFSFNCALVRSSVALSKVLTATFSRFNTIDSTSRQLGIHGCCYFRLEKKMQESYGIAARNVRFLMGFFRTLFNRHCRF